MYRYRYVCVIGQSSFETVMVYRDAGKDTHSSISCEPA